MTIQSKFNSFAIEKLPKITQLIQNAKKFESDQMIYKTICECGHTPKTLDDMTEKQLHLFENKLIKYFKEVNWID